MLFEALAGRLPFIAGTALEYMGQHAFKEPPALSTLAPQAPSELAGTGPPDAAQRPERAPTMRGSQRADIAASPASRADDQRGSRACFRADCTQAGVCFGKSPIDVRATRWGSLFQGHRKSQRWLLAAGAVLGGGMVLLALQVWRTQPASGPPASPAPPRASNNAQALRTVQRATMCRLPLRFHGPPKHRRDVRQPLARQFPISRRNEARPNPHPSSRALHPRPSQR